MFAVAEQSFAVLCASHPVLPRRSVSKFRATEASCCCRRTFIERAEDCEQPEATLHAVLESSMRDWRDVVYLLISLLLATVHLLLSPCLAGSSVQAMSMAGVMVVAMMPWHDSNVLQPPGYE